MNKTLPYKNELVIAAIVILTIFSVVKRMSWEKMQLARLTREETKLKDNENLVVKWQESSQKYKNAKGDFFYRDEITFKRFVQEAAWDNNVDIRSLRLSQNNIDFYQKAGIVLDCDANFQDINKFLKALGIKHIFVESLSLSSKDKAQRIQVSLFAYILPDEE